ncbi:MAG: RNA polymerase sigma factor [Clostridia bacterium]
MIYGIAFSILKNKEDSEDVVQIVFSKLYVLDKEKLPKEKEATWLYSVTKNEALSILKKKYNNVSLENIYNLEDNNNEIDKLIDRDSYNKLINKLEKKIKKSFH